MSNLSKGKYAQFISDRSGQAFPYQEMVIEWNGSRVHTSEFEPKHPQLEPKPTTADGQGLRNARPQTFTVASGGGGGIAVDLSLPAPFSFASQGMVPDDGSEVNIKREAHLNLGTVIAGVPAVTQNYAVTVASGTLYVVGGTGNVFYLDAARDMSLSIAQGTQIRFTQDDNTNDGHPLFITTSNSTDEATLKSGIVTSNVVYYLDGTSNETNYTNTTTFNAATQRYVEWTPSSTGTYYYACWVYGIGMGGLIEIT